MKGKVQDNFPVECISNLGKSHFQPNMKHEVVLDEYCLDHCQQHTLASAVCVSGFSIMAVKASAAT